MRVIQVRDLKVSYGPLVAVNSVSLEVNEGEVLAIVGPNGAGKTSLIETIIGLRQPTSGSVEVLGMDPRQNREELCRRIGAQLQQAALADRIKVGEALEIYSSFYNSTKDWNELLEKWGLEEKRKATFDSLSGGQKQRLFIALALVHDPEIVFLDEITTGLDPKARKATLELVQEIKAGGKTVILVSHYLDEVDTLADRVAIIKDGNIVACDSPAELRRHHGGEIEVSFSLPHEYEHSSFAKLPNISSLTRTKNKTVARGAGDLLFNMAAELARQGHSPEDFSVKRLGLEDVYFKLTGMSQSEEL